MLAPEDLVTIKVDGKSVVLDPKNMAFNELTLSDYLDHEYSWVDFFGKQLERVNKELLTAEVDAEALYSEKYKKSKDGGNTDAYAKAEALSDPEYILAKKYYIDRKEAAGFLKAHLKAWGANHENAQNRGNTLRQEMKKLNNSIYVDNLIGEAP